MRQIKLFATVPAERAGRSAPAFIAAGLAILLTATWWPAMPVVTAMALVALGATATTIARLRGAAAFRTLMAAHLFVYVSLYLLFVGAVCHAALTGPQDGLTFLQGLDLGVSAAVMMLVARLSLAVVDGGEDAPAR